MKVSRKDINEAVLAFRSDLQDHTSLDVKDSGKKFYDWLIAPIETELQQANVQAIVYAPDGQLRYIPLAALYDGKQWLVEKYRINNITARSLTDFNRRSGSQLNILAGASTLEHKITVRENRFSFGAIPATKQEVNGIKSKLPNTLELIDSTFTKSATGDRVGSHSIIHLATHGLFNLGTPDDSFIIFGDGDRLTLREIQDWTLKNVDLVVLSACQTGVGGKLGDGTEILGLGYQFHNTGARAVIASLWSVNDGGTQSLMDSFYTNIKKGNPPTESLRQSQIALIQSKEFSHPYYWSAFFLIGNGL
ncbi:CHAT domain-containing protein [Tumidithrix elongata RA019]|uniref:CHAT domain-containing protein n=1 Tax=Tumidithrix elongata BACA0141 TaxID=2716417 RepID=A0AAW9Q458_9CYAN|nr:CHAT domain-containing protein [Tumidithrix elongata RA019]